MHRLVLIFFSILALTSHTFCSSGTGFYYEPKDSISDVAKYVSETEYNNNAIDKLALYDSIEAIVLKNRKRLLGPYDNRVWFMLNSDDSTMSTLYSPFKTLEQADSANMHHLWLKIGSENLRRIDLSPGIHSETFSGDTGVIFSIQRDYKDFRFGNFDIDHDLTPYRPSAKYDNLKDTLLNKKWIYQISMFERVPRF